MSDEELLQLLKADSEKGLRAVIDKYGGYVYRIAYSKLGSVCQREDIEEAVSDIFAAFYDYARGRGFELQSVQAYLAVIAKRRSINLYKKAIKRADVISFDEAEEFIGEADKTRELHYELIDAIKRLGEPDSEIILRRYFLGQKSREIARALRLRPNTVDKKISRGLKKLKTILEKEEQA